MFGVVASTYIHYIVCTRPTATQVYRRIYIYMCVRWEGEGEKKDSWVSKSFERHKHTHTHQHVMGYNCHEQCEDTAPLPHLFPPRAESYIYVFPCDDRRATQRTFSIASLYTVRINLAGTSRETPWNFFLIFFALRCVEVGHQTSRRVLYRRHRHTLESQAMWEWLCFACWHLLFHFFLNVGVSQCWR